MGECVFYSNESDPTFLGEIRKRLKQCLSFSWSVSFIKKAGLEEVLPDIEEALARGAMGKILTSTYQNFTDIGTLNELLRLMETYPKRFNTHLEDHSFGEDGFHTKGYLFSCPEEEVLIVGSSNLTRFALRKNKEWDLALASSQTEKALENAKKEFGFLWAATPELTKSSIESYALRLQYALSSWDMDSDALEKEDELQPNPMQRKALKELKRVRDMGQNRAMIVAATGSGKTFLSAFDAKQFGARRLLFIVHKDMILREALKSYSLVFGKRRTYGLYDGNHDERDRDFVFATNFMVASHLNQFNPKDFDYMVIDEVHHATASTYEKILGYFRPEFCLGMTATPERMDEKSVYSLFGDNVPYDLRLRDAIEDQLVVPFHYFGIKDSLLDYRDELDSDFPRRLLGQLVAPEHVDFIAESIAAHRPIGMGKLKCVGFCRSVEHARQMSIKMAEKGYECTFLSGSNALSERIRAFSRLQDEEDPLQIIFAVDILNEGVDIPGLNMVLFLRPTESPTILLQQLGRGLRKYPGKPYLTVLDFIGNSYRRSVQIALAFGSLSKTGAQDPTSIRDLIFHPQEAMGLPGVEVHLDRESMEEILTSFHATKWNSRPFLKTDYQIFKSFLRSSGILKEGQCPMLVDFLSSGTSSDPLRFRNKDFPSYYDFVSFCDSECAPLFDESMRNVLRTLSAFLPLVRPEEFLLIQVLMEEGPKALEELIASCSTQRQKDNMLYASRVLEGKAVTHFPKWFVPLIEEKEGELALSFPSSDAEFSRWVKDLLSYGLSRYENEFGEEEGALCLHRPYSAGQVFLTLNEYKKGTKVPNLFNESGVAYLKEGLALFVDLKKELQKEERLKYQDRFLSSDLFQWESQTGTYEGGKKLKRLLSAPFAFLFVRRTSKDDPPYFYMGKAILTHPRPSQNTGRTFLFDLRLEKPVPQDLWFDFDIPLSEEGNHGRS